MPAHQTIGLTPEPQIEIISCYAATNQQIEAVSATPGWFVVGAFYLNVSVDTGRLQIIGAVSDTDNDLNARLFDLTTGQVVANSAVKIEEMIDTVDHSGVVSLVGGHLYQIQAEVIGPSGFGVLKTATLV